MQTVGSVRCILMPVARLVEELNLEMLLKIYFLGGSVAFLNMERVSEIEMQ